MFKSSYAIGVGIIIAILSIVVAIWNAARPDHSNGRDRNTYGTYPQGHRGLYELLDENEVPVDRSLLPPHANLQDTLTFALVDSDPDHIDVEPEYLFKLGEWVENGGHVVVALKTDLRRTWQRRTVYDEQWSLLEALDLDDQTLIKIKPDIQETTGSERKAPLIREAEADDFRSMFRLRSLGITADISTDSNVFSSINQLALPVTELQVLDSPATATKPLLALQVKSEDGINYTLAAVFPRGKGTISVLTDSELLHNRSLRYADNSFLAWQLFASRNQPVLFDEFYHGLTVQGNPFWLLTKTTYAFAAAMIALSIAIWLWRQSVVLGPPLPETPAPPRTIRDYLDAVSRMFLRSRARRFLLEESWTGTLWLLAKQLHPHSLKYTPHDLLAIIERRDPVRAGRFRLIIDHVNVLLQKKSITNEELRQATQRIKECL